MTVEAIAFRCLCVQEQIEWAVEEGADFIVAETFGYIGEAALALKCIKEYGSGKHYISCSMTFRGVFVTSSATYAACAMHV